MYRFLILLLPLLALAGCKQHHRFEGPSVHYSQTVREFEQPPNRGCLEDPVYGPPAPTRETINEATVKGPNASAFGGKIEQEVSGELPAVKFPGGGETTGGSFTLDATVVGGVNIVPIAAFLTALGCLAGAGYSASRRYYRCAGALILGALGFGAVAVYPGLLIWMFGLGVLGLVVLLIYYVNRSSGFEEVTRGVAEGVEAAAEADPKAVALVKRFLSKAMDDADKKLMKAVKVRDGLVQ